MTNSKVVGFEAYETLGFSIPNPRSIIRITIPSDLSPEQLAAFETWIDETNAKLEAEYKAEEARAADDDNTA